MSFYQDLNTFLKQVGNPYHKPEKAGPLADETRTIRSQGQVARAAFTKLAKALTDEMASYQIQRVSLWASQAQVLRPHFWCYFLGEGDQLNRPLFAIRLYGKTDHFGVSCELSYIERHKDEQTQHYQAKALDIPLRAPLYYWAQDTVTKESQRYEATESSRDFLKEQVKKGNFRKVLIKYDVPMTSEQTLSDLVGLLKKGFLLLSPYYDATKN